MSFPLREVWSELLRSTSNNQAVLKELLDGRPEIERATDLNCMFMNYISIIYKVFNIKIEGGRIDPRVWLPSDHEFVEMLKLLVRYINDITTWIEDHDRTGASWTSIGEFYAESLLEVDAQCQRWWVLADMTIFNPANTPFKTLPIMLLNEESVLQKFDPANFNRFKGAQSLSPMENSSTDISKFEAPPSPASSLKQPQTPSTASSSFSCQPATMSLDKGQIAAGFTDSWNHGEDSNFSSHNSYGDIDQGFLCNGGVEPGGLDVQQTPVFMPTTPRLEQNGFVPSHNPSSSFHQPVNKQGEFCRPMPPPARKIVIPRLQKQGNLEPLFPPTQHSELRPSLPTPQTFNSGTYRKRGYRKVSPQALSRKPKKRRAVAAEMPQHKPGYTGMQEFPPGSKLLPGSLMHGSPGSATGFTSGSYNTNHSASAAFSALKRNAETMRTNLKSVPHKVAIGSQMDWNNTVSTKSSPKGRAGNVVTTQQDWNDTVSAALDSERGGANTGLGISSPKISRDPSRLPGTPMMCTDMSIGYARPDASQQSICFSSPIHSPLTGGDLRGAGHKSSRHLHHSAVERDYVLGGDQSLENESTVFKPW
ncbi:uncharacterized protein Bfra_004710 [Botrytis fragariae]|uniref:Uncharacterized protein n=1 Tax=Botrytis fragariae TaxID=1964551 RepID=A0A8H6EK08_9HELO|nr:uncharacterized protein Bfra_004710 [Botrytis fragariae]KAF5874695.1 hypothetical protein Bfra_004710 [Botrytis fragariae]